MYPVFLHLPLFGRVFELHSFGVMVALGCAAGTLLAVREARRQGIDPTLVRDLCLWGLAAALLGARLFDLVANGRDAWDDCVDAMSSAGTMTAIAACTRPLRPWEGGLVFYGGLAAGLLTIWRFTRRHGMSLAGSMDLLTPSLAIGHVFGRLGCLLSGCCWGKPANVAWAIAFPEWSMAYRELSAQGALAAGAMVTPPLHPTQIYEAGGELILFIGLLAWRHRARFAGQVALAWLIGYSALRFVIELFRGDPSRAYFFELHTPALNRAIGLPESAASLLSTSQGIALLVLAIAATMLVIGLRRAHLGASTDQEALSRSTAAPRGPAAAPRG